VESWGEAWSKETLPSSIAAQLALVLATVCKRVVDAIRKAEPQS
jgi:hypothetical protein